jgi:hypothetical protein
VVGSLILALILGFVATNGIFVGLPFWRGVNFQTTQRFSCFSSLGICSSITSRGVKKAVLLGFTTEFALPMVLDLAMECGKTEVAGLLSRVPVLAARGDIISALEIAFREMRLAHFLRL